MDEQVRNILKYAVILFVITAVVAGLLAGINLLTKETIEQNSVKAEQKALGEVMPEAETFEAFDAEVAQGYGVEAIYAAAKADGTTAGYCVKVSQNGYGGAILAVVGVDMAGQVTGVSIISHAETPGLGANIEKDSFKGQYAGKGEVSVVKAGAKDGQINAVSGATISSKALTAGVNQAIEVAAQIQGGGLAAQNGADAAGLEVGADE